MAKPNEALLRSGLEGNIDKNLAALKKVLNAPLNRDVTLRPFDAAGAAACLVFMEGMAGRETIEQHILRPCLSRKKALPEEGRAAFLRTRVLESVSAREAELVSEVVEAVLSGETALLVDGDATALILDTRAYEKRAVGSTQSESVVQGPQEAFVENLRTNITQVRRILRSEMLITEFTKVGRGLPTQVAMMYLKGVAKEETVALARRRLASLDVPKCPGSGQLQQLIEDHPCSVFPQMLQTERPDRTASCLSDGQIALLVEGSPYALIAPVTLFHLIHASDDTFMRWQYGTFLRAVRLIGAAVSLFLPALYVAVTSYHTHMLPLNLLTSIAEARARVPLPVIAEVLFMEASFYLLNEAGTRIPNQLGSALGIVGALILGQAAVEASLISPILIIVVSLTGLGNYSIPDYGVSVGMQMLRLGFVALSAVWGLYGLCLGAWALCAYLGFMRSFGEPYLAPVAPYFPHNADILARGPIRGQFGRLFLASRGSWLARSGERGGER
ncbi:MAG: spore germination protein [Clostridia bacterium]|nr:spore germination protein [Clostridia bacterium]